MKSKWLTGLAVLVAVAVGVWWLGHTPTAHDPVSYTPPARTEPAPSGESPFAAAARQLVSSQTPEASRSALDRLRQLLASGSTNEISAAIRSLLDSKLDGATGQGFKAGAGGALLEAPTLRTMLLNQLAMIDPAGAAAYAREILKSPTSPEEWAVALQALARGDTGADAAKLLQEKTGELLRNAAWQKDPSVAYLEAFDTAVHLGGTDLVPPLTDLVREKDNPAVAHAAFLTLDRLAINQPAETLATLNEHPDWMTGREGTRANYFARADVGDPMQRQIVETYLLDATRGPAELQAFAGVFPNANFMISNNLLTSNATLNHATLVRRDATALVVVGQWLADSRFQNIRPQLMQIQVRLQEFQQQAGNP